MAEYIEREALMKAINDDPRGQEIRTMRSGKTLAALTVILEHLHSAPTVDAVPVVRCKDCCYYENGECVNPYIWMSDGAHMWPDPDFFCSYGEWKEGAER